MKRGRRSKYVVLLISLVLIFSLTGCKASKKKVLESSYYKELQKENKKLKKQNKSLKSKVDAENDMTEDEVQTIIEKCTNGRFLGLFGEETVNVLKVNLMLDGIFMPS